MKATITILRAAAFLVLCSVPLRADSPTRASIAGRYYRGDHLGYNLTLELAASGTYTATWTGCLGTYGTGKGRWKLEDDHITLKPSEEAGMMKKHLRELRLISQHGHYVLIPPSDLKDDYYRKYGADKFIAFHKQAPKK